MDIKRATGGDIEAIMALLRENGVTTTLIDTETLQHVYLAYTKDGKLAGVAAMRCIGNVALILLLVVNAASRGQGFGYLLMKTLDHAAKSESVEEIYVLSDDSIDYFKRYGYEKVERSSIPQPIVTSDFYEKFANSQHALCLHIAVTA